MSNIDKYTKFMSEQAKTASTGLFGTHKNGFVTEDVNVPQDHKIKAGNNSTHGGPPINDVFKNGKKIGVYTPGKSGQKHLAWVYHPTSRKWDATEGPSHHDTAQDALNHVIQRYAARSAEHIKEDTSNKNPHKDMEDEGFLHFHTTPEGHHIYAHEETDRGESLHYAVKQADGKVKYHDIEHGGEPVTDKQLNSPQKWHNVDKISPPSVKAAIHKDIKDETAD